MLRALSFLLAASMAWGLGGERYVSTTPSTGAFPLVTSQVLAILRVDPADWPGVRRAATDLQADVMRVTSREPALVGSGTAPRMVLIGTLGRSLLIDGLAKSGKIDVSGIRGKWESFLIQTVENPLPGVASALVIAGSDKRGTIFGIYDVSEQIGVSPWYWWADVTPEHHDALYVRPGRYQQGEPSIKYRGIFLNDEKPDLDYWVREKFGEHPSPLGTGTVANMNSKFYARLFEVLLRMRANYLWPAMWNNAFAEDDPENPRLADEYGIVMGSSHQEPMMRAQKEWDWHLRAANGNWNYSTQADILNQFWSEGVRARKDYENVYTIGLRGENDSAMVRTSAEGKQLTEKIVAAQRQMLAEETGRDAAKIPQMWSLYKEVQNYYEDGLRVPDDVTLLWADDNWGNLRRLPTAEERKRSGGAGIYYHFDYHGGPRSYQWVNSNPIPKIWDQMTLAKQYGADRIWIVNVGHFKGYEVPTEFFLNLAWNTGRWKGDNLNEFTRLWAEREFGAPYAREAAEIVALYTKYNGRRKPELLEPTTYSLTNFGEADRVVAEFNALTGRAEALYNRLPAAQHDAFYELVLFPTKASAQLTEMYVAAGKNALYAARGDASANAWAARVQELFDADAALTREFHALGGGRWDHFMDQPHIGYTSWQDPPENSLRAVKLTKVDGAGKTETVVAALRPAAVIPANAVGFVESDGRVTIEAVHYSAKHDAGAARFALIEDYGHTLSGMRAEAPVDVAGLAAGTPASPSLEYKVHLLTGGEATVQLTLGPALNFAPDRGVRIAVSMDHEAPQTATIVAKGYNAQNGNRDWEQAVRDNARFVSTKHTVSEGTHTLKVWMVDPGVVLERIVVATPAAVPAPSYLGPPESFHR